ncbi:NAD-dependent protein deacetylase sirtuin-3, mitochondrial isoform X1 [Myotis daubentonii]|uniref:NAD-dependent protein deacetylase sirtuin-3, mitochondrial isoform X1 n=2 Tax=Myotis daubentonii TaxID=98922 RepID=UPI0028737083|nr:NAD-dependent protein deacetylase sirtuin-3, mitochondrial isoform X1 [Myotis daubentonii]
MAQWARPAIRALRLWGPGGELAWARRPRFAGGRPPTCLSAGVAGVFGNGGDRTQELFLQDVAELIRAKACQRVVVMVGAGISTPSGIPDFRSPGTGFYSSFQHCDVPYPEAIFELTFFLHNPRPFFSWAKKMYPGSYRPNVIHYFLRLLQDKGLLLRLYTQNIDGLERAAGIPDSRLVEAHGSFASATCTVCGRAAQAEGFWAEVMGDRVPRCAVCTGVVKPDIVFFGEALPQRFLLHVVDFPAADLLLILGTSLQVEPFASLSEAVRSSVPRVFMNQEAAGSLAWRPRSRDVLQLGELVDSVDKLVELLGWTEELKDLVQRETGQLSGRDR